MFSMAANSTMRHTTLNINQTQLKDVKVRLAAPQRNNPLILQKLWCRTRVPSLSMPRSMPRISAISTPSSASMHAEQDPSTHLPVSDTWLGGVFLRLLPGYKQYLLSFLMPITVAAAAMGVIYGPQLLLQASTLPVVRNMTPVVNILTAVARQQPWLGLFKLVLSLLTTWYAFLLMPILDWVLGKDLYNPTPEQAAQDAKNDLFRSILYAYVPIAYSVIFIVMHLLCTSTTTPLAFIGVAISCGTANGILFTVAHELLHGSRKLDRELANLLLANVWYMHWSQSHLMHHVKVATPEDPSSARKGEWLFAFIGRSIWGNLVDGYGFEARRRAKKGIPFFSTHNRALWWAGGPVVIAAVIFSVYGGKGLAFWAIQATIGILLLETVNYIEHYGLVRKNLSSSTGEVSTLSRYEKVNPSHSWNSSTIYTNSVTFKLQRHSDHHAHDNRPYQVLETVYEAPQLPAGYPAMMLLSTVPPLFFKVMDPIVEQVSSGSR